MDRGIERELRQLWYVSEMYFRLAQQHDLSDDELRRTVGDHALVCESTAPLAESERLMRPIAHLMSCAVRLYAIEECIQSSRYTEYNRIKNSHDESSIRQEMEHSLDHYIHFLLRHMVAHCESKRSFGRHKIALEAMYQIYLNLDFHSIFQSMERASLLVKADAKVT